MAANDLPAGFEPVVQNDVPAGFEPVTENNDVPAGFQPVEDKGFFDSTLEGVKQAFRRQANTAGGGAEALPEPNIAAAEPLDFTSLPDSGTPAKLGYRIGESFPNIATGVLAGSAGFEATGNPYIGLAAGALGSAGEAAMETLGPAFQAELQKTPNDPDGAYDRALKTTANSGAWSAAGWLAGAPFFKGPIKNILFQTFVAQPATAAGQQASQNILEGKPVSDNVAQAAGEGAVVGIPMVAGHAVVSKAITGEFFPKPKGTPLVEDAPLPPGFENLDSSNTTNVPEQPVKGPPAPPAGTPPVNFMGEQPVVDSLPDVPPQEINQFDAAQSERLQSKFGGGGGNKIVKENDQQPPITDAEVAYNNAILKQRENRSANAVGDLRMQITGPDRPTQDRTDPPDIPARFDAAEATPAIEPQMEKIRGQIEKDPFYVAKRQNELDANIPRYVLGDGSDFTLHNATDLEEQIALQGAQKEFPVVHKVDLGSLDPTKITAGLNDLPPRANDRRVNLGQATPEMYGQLLMEPNRHARLGMYHELVDKYGLRVVPNPGKSFTYTGSYEGQRISALPKSERLNHILAFDSPDRVPVLIEPSMHDALTEQTDWYTLDPNAVDPKSLISVDPLRADEIANPIDRAKWRTLAERGDFAGLKEMHKKGVSVPADPKRDRAMIPVRTLKYGDLIPAYQPMPVNHRVLNPGKFEPRDPQVGVHIAGTDTIAGAIPELMAKANKIAEVLRDIQPVIDNIFKVIGAKNRPIFVVDMAPRLDRPAGPYADITEASVVIPVDFDKVRIAGGPLVGSLEHMVQQIVYHEVGHIITYRAWDNSPAEIKAQVTQAYQRARLAWQLTKEGHGSSLSLLSNPQQQSHMYYLTFSEYLAEQFRRWANQDQKILDNTDRFFKKGASALKQAYDMLDAKWGVRAREQMFQASWEFNSWMDYMEQAARLGKTPIQFMRASDRVALSPPLPDTMGKVVAEVQAAVDDLRKLIPEGWEVSGDKISPTDEQLSSGLNFGLADKNTKTIKLMLGALAWVDNTRDRLDLVNQVVVHEAWHAIEDFIAPKTRQMLAEVAKKAGVMPAETEHSYRVYLTEKIKEFFPDMAEADKQAMLERYIDAEHVAALVDSNHQGFRHGDVPDGILDRISAFIERIGNMLRGYGYIRAEDVLHEFYRGEITDRVNKINRSRKAAESQVIPPEMVGNVKGLRQVETKTGYKAYMTVGKDEAGTTTYTLYDAQSRKLVGHLEVDDKGEIQMLNTSGAKGTGLSEAILRHVEELRGEPFKTAQILTQQGYNFLNRRAPERVKYYVKDESAGIWMSPKSIWESVANLKHKLDALPKMEDVNKDWWKGHLEKRLAYMEGLAKKIPEMAKDDPALAEQWVRRNVQINEWQKDAQRRNGELSYKLTGDSLGGGVEDPYVFLKRQQEQEHEMVDGFVPQPEMLSIRGVFRRYGDRNPEVRRHIRGTTRGTQEDRTYTIQLWGNKQIALGKKGLMIRQLAWLNPHIPQLRDYVSWRDQQNQRRMQWVSRAAETAHSWDRLPRQQADRVSDMMFWATEMRYRTPAEVRNHVLRNPTQAEIAAYARQHGITRDGLQQYARVMNDFAAFLNDMQRVFEDQIRRRFATNPVQMNTELARLATDMNRLRSRPYFPMVRFGKYSVTVRDPNNRRVLHFSLHPTMAERDAAVPRIARQFPSGMHDISIAEVPEGVLDFMGLPGPMLDRIKNQLPGITTQQADWLDRFSQLMAPENSFRKRWLERQGTPGYSLDGIRAYAHYFRSGSSYLSKIEFHDQIRDTLRSLDDSVARAADGTSRAVIADTLRTHAHDMDTVGKDWVKLKAMTFLFQLGFSPVSAMMNLTQVPVVSYPYLSNLFGERAVLELGHNVARAGARTLFTRSMQHLQSVPGLQAAHEEMVRQGRIDIGQAAELGTFAESSRIDQTYLGARAQEALRSVSYWGAWMFGQTERFNREWLFETAYKLALQNPNHRHVRDLTVAKHRDWADVMSRTGMTAEQASAFLVAREAVDRTQFVYQSWDRPKWLRGPVAQATRIYFMYTQQMMFALANNPGRFKQLLIMGALYGAMGLPGADDLDALVHYLAVKVFGKDFNLKKAARQFVREHTEGTIFDKTGPDLFLHGISRYGFGLSMLGEGMGWPQFDVSANGSMGNIVPGFADLMNGLANAGADPDAYKNTATKVLQDIAGPGLGVMFPWLQYMASTPYSGDQAQWQKVLPRSLRAMVDAYRTAQAGGLTAPNGAVTQKLDWNDPADRATIIAQALGMRPRVANEAYEAYEIQNNSTQFYNARKLELAADFTRALRLQDVEAQKAVIAGIAKYNNDVAAAGIPDMSIQARTFISGIKNRLKNIAKTEAGLPSQKSQYMLQQQTKQLVPGLLESKPVR